MQVVSSPPADALVPEFWAAASLGRLPETRRRGTNNNSVYQDTDQERFKGGFGHSLVHMAQYLDTGGYEAQQGSGP